jgi:tetratricopeptide (TPR) repeat protein
MSMVTGTKTKLAALATLLVLPMTASLPASADIPGHHPYYLHALSDLRDARALLQRPDEANVAASDNDAVAHIDHAIGEIKRASIDDGKNLADHFPIDANLPRHDRFDKALALLRKADQDLHVHEDDRAALGWRERAENNVKEAIDYTKRALKTDHFDDTHQ